MNPNSKQSFRVWKKGQKGYFLALTFYACITFFLILCLVTMFPLLDKKSDIAVYFLMAALSLGSMALLIFILSRETLTIDFNHQLDTLIVIRGKEETKTHQFSRADSMIFEKVVVAVKSITSPDGLSKPVSSYYRIIFNQLPFNELCHFVFKKEMLHAAKLILLFNRKLKIESKINKIFVCRDLVKHYW